MSFLEPYRVLLFALLPLPVSTDERQRRFPWVTVTLIALNVAVFLATRPDLQIDRGASLFKEWGLAADTPQLSSFLSYMFLHVSPEHLFWNMMFLWLFGTKVEDAVGRVTFIALYLGGGIAAGLLHMAIVLLFAARFDLRVMPLIGASGAISAILAPYAVRFHRSQIHLIWLPGFAFFRSWGRLEVPAVAGLGVWVVYTLAGALRVVVEPQSSGIAYWAHVGGFIFGLLAAELTDLLREGRQQYLIDDARAAAARGGDDWAPAKEKYRQFLQGDRDNTTIRAEFARALARRIQENPAHATGLREEAGAEMIVVIRALLGRNDLGPAVALASEALALRLPLPLNPRERLHLGAEAADRGDTGAAITLLEALLEDTPRAAESEMARIRLARVLLGTDPDHALRVLREFEQEYPESYWAEHVRQLIQDAGRSVSP